MSKSKKDGHAQSEPTDRSGTPDSHSVETDWRNHLYSPRSPRPPWEASRKRDKQRMKNDLGQNPTIGSDAIDAATVDRVAALARLSVTDAERNRLADDLSEILGHMAKLETLDTTDVPATSHPLDLTDAMDQDEPRPGLLREDVMKIAPATADGVYFAVPPVLGGDRG